MKRTLSLAMFSLFVLVSHAFGQNVLTNWDFEPRVDPPWPESLTLTGANPHSGSYCVNLADNDVHLSFEPIPANRIVEATFWLRHESVDPDLISASYAVWMEEKDGSPLVGAVPLRAYHTDWWLYHWAHPTQRDFVISGLGIHSIGGPASFVDDVRLVVDGLQVSVDFAPKDASNTVDLRGNGYAPVAILGTETFDVHLVDQASLALDGCLAKQRGNSGKMGKFDDVNGDSFPDLVVRFSIADLKREPETKYVELSGQLLDGTELFGVDAVDFVDGPPHRMDSSDVKSQLVPEPATLGLLAMGGLALIRRRRKRAATM